MAVCIQNCLLNFFKIERNIVIEKSVCSKRMFNPEKINIYLVTRIEELKAKQQVKPSMDV